MKVGVAIYYKNIEQYPERWVKKCIDSIKEQTYKDFKIYVLSYDEFNRAELFKNIPGDYFYWKPLQNYAAAMNYLFEIIFEDCDLAANVNIDDWYDTKKLELQLPEIE